MLYGPMCAYRFAILVMRLFPNDRFPVPCLKHNPRTVLCPIARACPSSGVSILFSLPLPPGRQRFLSLFAKGRRKIAHGNIPSI